ncbi:MAG TPA: hypothetical protein VMR41_05155 [Patescibacteria group bacterium]|jgi:hypothetical protein|nr:hypothetical protein [Patescibacteria group bacterium]
MDQLITWLSAILGMSIGTLDTVDVTLGMIVAGTLILGIAFYAVKKLKGRS